MLTCLTANDALQLLRKTTLRGFFSELYTALSADISTTPITVNENNENWREIVGSRHLLSRNAMLATETTVNGWAIWSEQQTAQPLLLAAWRWWEDILQATASVCIAQRQYSHPQRLAITDLDTRWIWPTMAVVCCLGVDEVFFPGDKENAPAAWQAILEHMPAVVHWLPSASAAIAAADWCWTAANTTIENTTPITLQQLEPLHWFRLFAVLHRLTESFHVGHRVDFLSVNPESVHSLDQIVSQ